MQNILLSSSPEWCYQLQQLQQENGTLVMAGHIAPETMMNIYLTRTIPFYC